MKKKIKMANECDLWKAYNLGLLNLENLSKENQRDIASYNEAMKEKVPEDRIKQFIEIYGEYSLKNNELLIKHLAKYYGVDTFTIEIRISQIAEDYKNEKQKIKTRN